MTARAARAATRLLMALGLLAAAGMLAVPAFATWVSSVTAEQTVSSATLAAPAGTTASRSTCTPLLQAQVLISWTATSSTFADGYQVLRSTTSGGPYTSVGTVSGRGTTSFTDATVAFSTTYHYVVQATRNQWRSPNSTQASVTTPNVLCLRRNSPVGRQAAATPAAPGLSRVRVLRRLG